MWGGGTLPRPASVEGEKCPAPFYGPAGFGRGRLFPPRKCETVRTEVGKGRREWRAVLPMAGAGTWPDGTEGPFPFSHIRATFLLLCLLNRAEI